VSEQISGESEHVRGGVEASMSELLERACHSCGRELVQCGQPSRPTAGDGRAVRVLARTDGTAQICPSRPSL
jgi:hypothetical protein